MRCIRPRRYVQYVQARITDHLTEDEPRPVVHVLCQVLRAVGIYEADLDPELGKGVREQGEGAAVELRGGKDVVTRGGEFNTA